MANVLKATNQLDKNIDQTLVTSVPDKSSLLQPRPEETWNSQCTKLHEERKCQNFFKMNDYGCRTTTPLCHVLGNPQKSPT